MPALQIFCTVIITFQIIGRRGSIAKAHLDQETAATVSRDNGRKLKKKREPRTCCAAPARF
ncbi:MAG: hypothetical protein Kow00120_12770 [Anaerolineae bacterium]